MEDVSLSASESQSGKKSANFRPWSERDDVSAAEAAARAATAAAAETARRGHYYHSKYDFEVNSNTEKCVAMSTSWKKYTTENGIFYSYISKKQFKFLEKNIKYDGRANS